MMLFYKRLVEIMGEETVLNMFSLTEPVKKTGQLPAKTWQKIVATLNMLESLEPETLEGILECADTQRLAKK